MNVSILVVDDDAELSGMLLRLLQGEGWSARAAPSASEGERLLAIHRPMVVLLDVMLADANGIDVCRRWRAQFPEMGILMLSARGEPMDRVLGLEVGADDYLAKPFERRELVARVRALLRRQQPTPNVTANRLTFGGLEIDLLRREVWSAGKAVSLTGIEFKLLAVLARNLGKTLSRHSLSDSVQTGSYRPLDRTVDVQVGRLRRKLQNASPGHEWISTVRGEGYVLTAPAPGGGEAIPVRRATDTAAQ
jgi:two-component system phosphate regulon response regulator OmpR